VVYVSRVALTGTPVLNRKSQVLYGRLDVEDMRREVVHGEEDIDEVVRSGALTISEEV
jgi:hypothetical protein